jgi:hypothetical protein
LSCQQASALGGSAVQVVGNQLFGVVAAPSLATHEFECDRPARACVSAGKECESWQWKLRIFPYFHGVAVIESIVRVEVGKEE